MQNPVEGDVGIALAQIRDVVGATMGFDALAADAAVRKWLGAQARHLLGLWSLVSSPGLGSV